MQRYYVEVEGYLGVVTTSSDSDGASSVASGAASFLLGAAAALAVFV